MTSLRNIAARRLLHFLTAAAEPAPDGGRVRLRTLNLIRWVAVIGQTAALVIVYVSFGFDLPIVAAFLLVGTSVAVNLHAIWAHPRGAWLGDRAAAIYLGYDLIQLALLLALTGGLANPFAVLILAPVTVCASVLSRTSTLALAGLAIVAVTGLGLWHAPLPWITGGIDLPWLYTLGIWVALVMSVVFISAYVFSLAAEKQRMSDALSATQMALAREQRLSALGGLAAAAAHELGSPLGTIAVVARELAQEVSDDSALKEDAELLLQESARCREILARLAARPDDDGGAPFNRLPLSALAESAAHPFQREGVELITTVAPRDETSEPTSERKPEILHAVGTLVENAVRFAKSCVELQACWDQDFAEIVIRDDGPGFDPDLLPYLGEPYVSGSSGQATRDRDSENMGLGIFIARTLLARTGAEVRFVNRAGGGAEVKVQWPRGQLESGERSERPDMPVPRRRQDDKVMA